MNSQARLTDREKRRLPLGNQYTERRKKAIMKWQVVKAAAMTYEVRDWTAKVDPELTYLENVELMRLHSCNPRAGGPTMRELREP